MAKKMENLQAALSRSAANAPAAAMEPVAAPSRLRPSKQTGDGRQDRHGRVSLVSWQPEQARRNLKMMAAAQGRDVQDLILEALNDLFAKHDMPHVQGD